VHPRLVIALFLLVMATSAAMGMATGKADDPCWNATIRGTQGNDVLRGSAGRDVIAGGAGNDVLIGGAGDDILCGGSGRDKLRGQAGDDALFGGDDERFLIDTEAYEWAGDSLAGGPGDDILDGGYDQQRGDLGEMGSTDRITFVGSRAGVNVDLLDGTATGQGHDTIRGPMHSVTGTRHDDTLLGTNGPDEFESSAGADRVDGRGGDDFISDSNSAATTPKPHDELGTTNTLIGGPGNDFIQSGSGDDDIRGGPGDDNLNAAYGVDRLTGGPGDDQLIDMIDTQSGHRLDGGPGNDTLGEVMLYTPADLKAQDAQTDSVGTIDLTAETLTSSIDGFPIRVPLISVENASAGWGTWTMVGTDGPNELIASDEKHPIRMFGRGGNDDLMGSFEHDLLDGGAGHDTALWTAGHDEKISIEKVRR
jgi:Ca2+-binding RTX toxin-like protein